MHYKMGVVESTRLVKFIAISGMNTNLVHFMLRIVSGEVGSMFNRYLNKKCY